MPTLAELITQKTVLEEQIANFQESDEANVDIDVGIDGDADCRIQALTAEYDSRLS